MAPASRYSLLVTFALGASLAVPAFAQLPWQAQPAPPPPPYGQPAPAPHYLNAPYQPPVYAPPHRHHPHVVTREQDDRHLDLLATKFYGITAKDPQVVPKLKDLRNEVHAFRMELQDRPYDVRDIIHDTRKLEWRIDAQRKKIEDLHASNYGAPPPDYVPPAKLAPSSGDGSYRRDYAPPPKADYSPADARPDYAPPAVAPAPGPHAVSQ